MGSALSWIEKNKEKVIRETDYGTYVLAGEKISEHILSNVISIMHKNMNSQKPLFGFAVSEEGLKISARATGLAVSQGINLKEILSTVSVELGGEGGGHAGASGASIPAGTEDLFIDKIEKISKALRETATIEKLEKELKDIKAEDKRNRNTYAQAGYQEVRAERQGKGREAERQGPERNSQTGAQSGDSKKMERKGLVQYFSS